MIFWRAKELLEGGSELFRAEAELMSKRVRRLLVGSVFIAVVGLISLTALALITAGAVISLSYSIGIGPSLMSVGGFYLLLCLCVFAVSAIRLHSEKATASSLTNENTSPSQDSPREKAEDAKDRLENAASTDPDEAPNGQDGLLDGLDSLKDTAIEVGMKNPVALGSAALLVVSLLGPGKTFKMISRGAAAAGLASTLLDTIGSGQDTKSDK